MIVLLVSCHSIEQRDFEIVSEHPESQYFVVRNNGAKTAYFNFENNGVGMADINAMVKFIANEYRDMPNAEKVWRFISDYTRHFPLISRNNWLYHPLLLVHSAGGSLCGFRSAAMTNILLHMGEQARSWCINGHVVSEVFFDGKWHVYDPDLGCIYFNEQGEICSFDELTQNPEYITNPLQMLCISDICDSLQATSPDLAAMYASSDDNQIFNTQYPQFAKEEKIFFMLAPGAEISFPLPLEQHNNYFALAALKIPEKWVGTVSMPYIPYNSRGNAKISYSGKFPNADLTSWQSIVSKSEEFNQKIIIHENLTGVIVEYYINALLYKPEKKNHIVITGENIESIEVQLVDFDNNNSFDWDRHCNSEFEFWNILLTNCPDADSIQVNSASDYIEKMYYLQDCKGFEESNIDTALFNAYIRNKAQEFSNQDNAFWQQFNERKAFILSWMYLIKESKHVAATE